MASNRLARLVWYNGRLVSGADLNDMTVSRRLTDIHSRKPVGSKYLRKAPTVGWVTAGPPAVPTMTIDNIDGFIDHLPIYGDGTAITFDPTVGNELHADEIGGIIGDTAVSGPGFFRAILIGVAYTEIEYDDETDINDVPVEFRRDDGVCIKIIAGDESASANPPDPDVADDIMLIARIIREDSDEADMIAGTTLIQLIQTYLKWREEDVPQTILQNSLLGQTGGMSQTVQYQDPALSLIASKDRYYIPWEMNDAGDRILITNDAWFILNGKIRRISDRYTPGIDTGVPFAFRSDVLAVPASDRLYLRVQLDEYDTIHIYVLEGTEPVDGVAYSEDPNTAPDPTGSSGGEVSTMALDVLLGVVDHSTASWVAFRYDNNPNIYEVDTVTGDYTAGQDTASAITSRIELDRYSAHSLKVDMAETDATLVPGSWATDRTPQYSTLNVIHTRHEEVFLKVIGLYATLNGGTGALELSSSDIYYRPTFQYTVRPKFVWT